MAIIWKTILLDVRTGSVVEQDITPWVNSKQTRPPAAAWDGYTRGELHLTDLHTFTAYIANGSEVWQGWRDTTTNEWVTDAAHEYYGYIIQTLEGQWTNAVHNGVYTTVSYDWLLDSTDVYSWPTDIQAGQAPRGWPPGNTVRDWLIGVPSEGLPYTGMLPFHFPFGNMNFGGVAPVFNAIFFTETCLPSMPNVDSVDQYGLFGFLSLRDLIGEITKGARYQANQMGMDVRPGVSVRPLAVGTQIIPRFLYLDLKQDAQDMPVAATYRQTPNRAAGEYGIEADSLRHTRGGDRLQTGVTVMADGDKAEGMIWSVATNALALTRYPTRFHRHGYIGGPVVINSDITSQAECDAFAARLAAFVGAPIGTLTWKARGPFTLKAGDYVMLDYPPEGQLEHILAVVAVERDLSPENPHIVITAGERPLDLSSVLRPRTDAPRITTAGTGGMEGQHAATFAGGPGVVDTPRYRPLVNVATTSKKNVIAGRNNAITPLIVQQTPAAAPAGALGAAVGSVPPAADIFIVRIWNAITLAWRKMFWIDKNGVAHQQAFFIPFVTASTYPMTMWQTITFRAATMPSDPATHSATYALSRNRAGTVIAVATVAWTGGATVLSAPFEVITGDQVIVVASSVTVPSPLTLISGDPLT